MQNVQTHHVPVMMAQVLESAAKGFADSQNYSSLDCTLGGGGHAEAVLGLDARVELTGLDRDAAALARVEKRLGKFAGRTKLIHSNFSDLGESLGGDQNFGFVLADLGLSSDQLDDSERGFTFRASGPLDMRIDQSKGVTAEEIVNNYELPQLAFLLKVGGVRRGTRQIAEAIVAARPLSTTAELEAAVTPVVERLRRSSGEMKSGSHPATVVFQALRMAVNDELSSLKRFLESAVELLAEKGILAIISFHSGEDKLVAQTMRRWSRSPEVPTNVALYQVPRGLGEILTKKAVFPTEDEQNVNPRARSARMRVFQKGEAA